jgi:hypothetical protein
MTTSVIDNGVNVEALLGAREAFADAPEIARFQWRSTVSWVLGTHSRAEVETFHGFGDEQRHSRSFGFDIDHPLQFAAQDNGITPVEYVWSRSAAASPRVSLRWPSSAVSSCARCRPSCPRTWTCTASWARTRRSATASAGYGSTTTSTPTRPRSRSRPWSRSRGSALRLWRRSDGGELTERQRQGTAGDRVGTGDRRADEQHRRRAHFVGPHDIAPRAATTSHRSDPTLLRRLARRGFGESRRARLV